MRKKILITLLISIAVVHAISAQHYQSYRSDRKYSYDDKLHLGFTSATLNGTDSVFRTYDNIWKNDSLDCWNTSDGSFIGKSVIIGKNGFDVFLNKAGDSIKINRHARLNDSWIFYKGDTLIFEASITRHDTMQFLDQVDSVKTIKLAAFDTAMNPVSHWLASSSTTLLLSKNYGLIRGPFFRMFPDFFAEMYRPYEHPLYVDANGMNVIGITEPDIGFNDLSTFAIYDFDIGDELHIHEHIDAGYNPSSHWRSRDIKTRMNYLERRDYLPDSIIYTVRVRKRSIEHWKDSSSNVYSNTIVNQKIVPNNELDQPSETFVNGNRFYLSEDRNAKILSDIHSSLPAIGPCISPLIADGCFSTMTYRKGLGGPYHWCENTISYLEKEFRELVYYKKGNDEQGQPFTDVGMEELDQEYVTIYPNPATHEIRIVFDQKTSVQPIQIELYTIMGTLVSNKQVTFHPSNPMVTVNIMDLPNGSYFIYCSSASESWKGRFEVIR